MNEKQIKTSPKINKRYVMIAIAIFVIAVSGVVTFRAVRAFISTWEMTDLPGIAVDPNISPTSTGDEIPSIDETSIPDISIPMVTPEPWDGGSRISILIMGIDYRDWIQEDGHPRTDTMIVLTLDPIANTAGMVSVPRDLWVKIPGFSYSKINNAYPWGEGSRLPGGGPTLAMQTVEQLLGVPIQYYAMIDFGAFTRFIDEIGGVKLDIKEEIRIDLIGETGTIVKILEPGRQTLPGDHALAYARNRKTEGGDFDRAERQQEVILSIRERLLSLNNLPSLIAKAPRLYQELSSGIKTNLDLQQAVRIAWFAQQIESENIKRGIIGPPDMVLFSKSPKGLDILIPKTDAIRILRDEIFANGESLSPAASNGASPSELMIGEGTQIDILNGTYTPGLAGLTGEYLATLGVDINSVADSNDKPYSHTVIYDHTGKPYTVKFLVELMSISEYRIHHQFDPESSVDITLILGNDWANNNPMP